MCAAESSAPRSARASVRTVPIGLLTMRISLLCTTSTSSTAAWVSDALHAGGHVVDLRPWVDADARSAAYAGHALADRWSMDRPDVVVALGWQAGLAATIGARPGGLPVTLRLTRAGRAPGSEDDRWEMASARSARRVLVPSTIDVDRLVDRGVRRTSLRVLPEAVDRTLFVDSDAEVPARGRPRIAVACPDQPRAADAVVDRLSRLPAYDIDLLTRASHGEDELAAALRSAHALVVTDDSDAEVALALRAMSCAVPVVAVATGSLTDIVADEVTGLLVRRSADVTEALRSLLAGPLRRQSMGLAGVDRVRARFDTAVVGAALEGLLLETLPRQVAAAS